MLTMYLCFLAGGAVLPVISFIFGALGDGADVNVDTDLDMDLDMDLDVDVDMDVDADVGTGLNLDAGAGSASPIETELDPGSGVDSIFSIGFLPTSLMALSALAITFGAVGGIMTSTGKGETVTLIAAAISGYIASVIVQTIIKTLKRAQGGNNVVDENELMLYDGKVIDTILPGQIGSISFTTLKNVLVSYPAKCSDESLKLEPGRLVRVVEKRNGVFIVEPKNKYE